MPATSRARSAIALPLVLVLVLVILSTLVGPAPSASAATRAHRIDAALSIVKAQKGEPYRYGAAGPDAFDCSGLVYYSYRKAGFNVPRTSDALAQAARRIARSNLRRGDLVFFHNSGDVYHVGVYAGRSNGHRMIIHAPYTGQRVHRARIWSNNWFPGTLR